MDLEALVSLNFCILSLFLGNYLQALYVNPGCLKCFSGMILCPANKNLFIISFILYLWPEIRRIIGIS